MNLQNQDEKPLRSRTIKTCTAIIVLLDVAFTFWVVTQQVEGAMIVLMLIWTLLPNLPILFAIRRVHTLKRCAVVAIGCAVVDIGACYAYFDGFFIHVSSLNSVLLLQVPTVQLLITLSILAFVPSRKRT